MALLPSVAVDSQALGFAVVAALAGGAWFVPTLGSPTPLLLPRMHEWDYPYPDLTAGVLGSRRARGRSSVGGKE